MLKRKKQRRYLSKRCQNIRHYLQAYADSRGREDLHKLRVELKKIKAFMKLHKQKNTIREIFQHAGMIREADLNLEMMKQFHINQPAVKTRAQKTLKNEPDRFCAEVEHYGEIIQDACSDLKKQLSPIKGRKIKHWVSRQLKKIAVIIETDQLHATRKRIKNLVYIHALYPKLPLNTEYLDQLQDTIGKWHDAEVAIGLLKKHSKALVKLRDESYEAVRTLSQNFKEKVAH
jgi:CHAD domain-containing protein